MKTADPAQVDLVFRAFSDRTRLRMLNLLRDRRELCVCDLTAVLGIPQAKASRHLAYLRRAKLVLDRREGLWVHYRLAPPGGTFHRKMLECLNCCLGEIPELTRDLERLHRRLGRESAAPGCCAPRPAARDGPGRNDR
jgi:ArsR family transcriptional regulator